jgi:dynactin complex subunit
MTEITRLNTEELKAIRKRAEKVSKGNILRDMSALAVNNKVVSEDVPKLLAEIERLRRELSFIAHVDLVKNAYDKEHIAVSVKSWALNVLDGVNHDD